MFAARGVCYAWLVGLGLMFSSLPALAEEPSTAPSEPARRWYGWQTLTTDAAAIALACTVPLTHDTTSRTYEGGVIGLTGATYLFGGPVVHFAHGDVGKAFGSLGLRVGAPLVLGGLGYLAFGGAGSGGDNGWVAGLFGAVVGGGIGVATAIAVDAAVLGYEDVPRQESSVRLTPWIDVGNRRTGLGVSGAF